MINFFTFVGIIGIYIFTTLLGGLLITSSIDDKVSIFIGAYLSGIFAFGFFIWCLMFP